MHTQEHDTHRVELNNVKRKPFHKGLRFLALAFVNWIGTQHAIAQETTESPMTGHLLQTTLGLLFVLGLLFALVWVLKRAGITGNQKRGGFYKIIATSSLGPREKIVLAEVGDTWLVLGITSHSINTLHSMPAGSIELEDVQNPAMTFAKMLERIKTGKATP